jgi:hypothetical protein
MEYIMKQANLYCHGKIFSKQIWIVFFLLFSGGFYGCEHAITDVRCRQSAREFYSGKAFDSGSKKLIIEWDLFLTIALICWWNI